MALCLLEGFVKTGGGLRLALRSCKAEDEDAAELEALIADVDGFKKWAEDGLVELRRLAGEEARK